MFVFACCRVEPVECELALRCFVERSALPPPCCTARPLETLQEWVWGDEAVQLVRSRASVAI